MEELEGDYFWINSWQGYSSNGQVANIHFWDAQHP